MSETMRVYVCKRCLTPSADAGKCGYCGGEKVGCRTGDPDDPCRRPLMDRDGQVRTRAPQWWLRHTVPELMDRFETPPDRT